MLIDRKIAEKKFYEIIEFSQKYYNKNLAKPARFLMRSEVSKHGSFYPCGWNPFGEYYELGCNKIISLSETWWNHSPFDIKHKNILDKLSMEAVLTIVFAHEISHMLFPESIENPWVSECDAMKKGHIVSTSFLPETSIVFPEKLPKLMPLNDTGNITYQEISSDKELCRSFQWNAYFQV